MWSKTLDLPRLFTHSIVNDNCMICIVSGTNRKSSNTLKVAQRYMDMLEAQGAEVEMVDLARLPITVAFSELYGERSEDFSQKFISKVEKAKKFVFVIPEYNGGFPGILKLFIDSLPPALLHNKKAGLIGLSSGMTGALRAMDQFSNVLNYLQIDVIASKPKLSGIEQMINSEGRLSDERCLKLLQDHAEKMIKF